MYQLHNKTIGMKNILIPAIIALLIWSCSPTQHVSKKADDKIKIIDSTEYEIIITDLEFETWYVLNFSPVKDYSNNYYLSKNRVAVNNWNEYFASGHYSRVIDDFIPYNPTIDYGIEVNRKLYWYFTYIEETYHIRLLK
jgi:hypothetical protein